VPVYWLGETFEPGHGLPRLRLAHADSIARGEPRNPRVTLSYADRLDDSEQGEGVQLDVWTRGQWRDVRESRGQPFALRCRQSRALDLPRGRAVLFRGLRRGGSCDEGKRRRGTHMALVHVGGVVVVVDTLSLCDVCSGTGAGPYNSFHGMAAIARGLERRLAGTRFSGAPDLLAAPVAEAASGPSGKLAAGAEETVLRLHDLPPGYAIEGDSGCEAFEPTGLLESLDRWIVENRPEGCKFEYERRFRVPGYGPAPLRVVAESIGTPSARAAAKGIGVVSRLIHKFVKVRLRKAVSIGPGGATATLYRYRQRFVEDPETTTLILWQHGNTIAALTVGGMTPQNDDRAALHYARIQQGRLEAPSPYTEAERDDTEVELDDPSLKVPVYWVGRVFHPGRGWPTEELRIAKAGEDSGLPGVELILRYDGFDLETWTRQSWTRFRDSFRGSLSRRRCARTTAFEWEGGHALISAGYARRRFPDGCPSFPPTRYRALAHIGGVVIGVNQTTCRCLSPGSGLNDSSLAGMKAILRGLTLRPKPAY